MTQRIDLTKPHGYCLDCLRRLKYLYINTNSLDLAVRQKREQILRMQSIADNHKRAGGTLPNRRAQEAKSALLKLEDRYISRIRQLAGMEKRVEDWLDQVPVGLGSAAIRYHYVNGLPWPDVAEILNRPVSNVSRTAQKTVVAYGHLFK